MHLIDLISSKLELFRLEQRYTKRRNRRSTFVSEAQYVDGEYVYSPTSAFSPSNSKQNIGASNSTSESEEEQRGAMVERIQGKDGKEGKLGRRLSKMGLGGMDWRKGGEKGRAESRVSVREIRWEERS